MKPILLVLAIISVLWFWPTPKAPAAIRYFDTSILELQPTDKWASAEGIHVQGKEAIRVIDCKGGHWMVQYSSSTKWVSITYKVQLGMIVEKDVQISKVYNAE